MLNSLNNGSLIQCSLCVDYIPHEAHEYCCRPCRLTSHSWHSAPRAWRSPAKVPNHSNPHLAYPATSKTDTELQLAKYTRCTLLPAIKHHDPLAGSILYCLVVQAHVWTTCPESWSGTASWLQFQHPKHYTIPGLLISQYWYCRGGSRGIRWVRTNPLRDK